MLKKNKKKYCPVCKSNNIKFAFKLNSTPLEDCFQKKKITNLLDRKLPLNLIFCKNCTNLFLDYFANPISSYKNYSYNTSLTSGLNSHYDEYAIQIKKKYFKKFIKPRLIDIGSNDGSLLNSFKKIGFNILGIEPAKSQANYAVKSGLPTINGYLKSEICDLINKKFGKSDLLTANYMLANVKNLNIFVKNISKLIDNKGLIVIQTGYHPKQFDKFMFDYIYHEHFNYFSIKSLEILFNSIGFRIIDIDINNFKGGSIRVFFASKNNNKFLINSKIIAKFHSYESSLNLHNYNYYYLFINKINNHKVKIFKFLKNYKKNNIIGFGASHSTTTLIHHFNLDNFLSLIIDDNPQKHLTFSPGYKIPVYNSKKLNSINAELIIILAWQHKHGIYKKHLKTFEKMNLTVVNIMPDLTIESKIL
jgi:hypothetical protein